MSLKEEIFAKVMEPSSPLFISQCYKRGKQPAQQGGLFQML